MVARIEAQVASLSTTGTGRNLFPGPERGVDVTPSLCVFVEDFGGVHDFHNDGGMLETQLQATTRSARNQYAAGKAIAREVHDALARVENVTINGTRYTWIRAIASGPTAIGPGDSDSEYFVETFVARYEVLP